MVVPTKREKFLYYALKESLKLQCHYAKLLNMYDGGERIEDFTFEHWINRLIHIHGAEIQKAWTESCEEITKCPL